VAWCWAGDWCDLGLDRTDCYSSDKVTPRTQRRSMRPVFRNRNIWPLLSESWVFGERSSHRPPFLKHTLKMSTELLRTFRVDGFNHHVRKHIRRTHWRLFVRSSQKTKIFILVRNAWLAGNNPVRVSQPIELWFLIPLVGFLDAIGLFTMYASQAVSDVGHEYAPLGISIITLSDTRQFSNPNNLHISREDLWAKLRPRLVFHGGFALAMIVDSGIREPFKANSNIKDSL